MKQKKTLLITIFLIALFALSGCKNFKPENSEFEIYKIVNGDWDYTEEYLVDENTLLYRGDTLYLDCNYVEHELWDFGNGIYDDGLFWFEEMSPYMNSYIYDTTGTFVITHTTFSSSMKKRESYTREITILSGIANLNLIVEDENGTPIEQAEIILFETYENWLNDENPVYTDYTDNLGQVIFENIEAKLYYVDIKAGASWYLGYEIELYRGNNNYIIIIVPEKKLTNKETTNKICLPKF